MLCHLTLSRLREELVGGDKEISLPHWVVILALHIVIFIVIVIIFIILSHWVVILTLHISNVVTQGL